jgi:hypothetical protein
VRAGLDIVIINAEGFYFNFYKNNNELFGTSLYEIDRLIDERQNLLVATEKKLAHVPEAYRDFIDIFLKTASDQLPPHRSYNHKITLESNNILKYSPLYKMFLEKLETLKQYFINNLEKDFIEPSQSPFAAPVLFIKKPNKGLRFYIDYRKLNLFIRKN